MIPIQYVDYYVPTEIFIPFPNKFYIGSLLTTKIFKMRNHNVFCVLFQKYRSLPKIERFNLIFLLYYYLMAAKCENTAK